MAVGDVYQQLFAFEARSRATQHRLASGRRLGPETSVDKIMVATAEQALFDLVPDALAPDVLAGDDPTSTAMADRVPLFAGGNHLRRHRSRSSATSSLAGCSSWEPIGDGRTRAGPLRAKHPGRAGQPAPRPASMRRSVRWDGTRRLSADPRSAIGVLFELGGELNMSPPIDAVMAWTLCPGDPLPVVVLPAFGRWDAPAERRGSTVTVNGLGSGEAAAGRIRRRGHQVRHPDRGPHHPDGATRPSPHPEAWSPRSNWLEVGGDVHVGPAPGRGATDEWRRSVAVGQLALSHQLVGAARSMLQLARAHAVERVQFERPISSFQAVRHRLADGLVAIEAAEASLAGAWDDRSPFSASLAKAMAGKSARIVSRHAQQVLAGMGFTAEHPLHRFVKRALTLDQLLGAAGAVTESIGEQLIQSRTLPAGLPL